MICDFSAEFTMSIGNQLAPCRGLPGPPGPKCRKMSPGASGPEMPKKSQKSLGDSPASLRRVSGKCLLSVLGLFGDFLGSRGQRPWGHFRDFFGISGPEGPGDLCKGRAGSQNVYEMSLQFACDWESLAVYDCQVQTDILGRSIYLGFRVGIDCLSMV